MAKKLAFFLRTTVMPAVLIGLLSSCAYQLGSLERKIPGGYRLIAVPVFVNKTQEVGMERFFTQAMIMEVEKTNLARVTSKEDSQAILQGEIKKITYEKKAEITPTTKGFDPPLPSGTILSKGYNIIIEAEVRLTRSSDMALLWSGSFKGEGEYPAPVITTPVLNTANPLYNQSARMQNIQQISEDMMSEAFERLTENF